MLASALVCNAVTSPMAVVLNLDDSYHEPTSASITWAVSCRHMSRCRAYDQQQLHHETQVYHAGNMPTFAFGYRVWGLCIQFKLSIYHAGKVPTFAHYAFNGQQYRAARPLAPVGAMTTLPACWAWLGGALVTPAGSLAALYCCLSSP